MKKANYYTLTIYRFGSLGHGDEIFKADFQKAPSARLTAVSIAHAIMDRKIGLFADRKGFDIIPENMGHDEMAVRVEHPTTHEVPVYYKFIVAEKPLHTEFLDAEDARKFFIGA